MAASAGDIARLTRREAPRLVLARWDMEKVWEFYYILSPLLYPLPDETDDVGVGILQRPS